MLIAGSDDGAYRLTDVREPGSLDARKVLDAGRVMRVRTVEELDGVFAATETGLYHSHDGTGWTDLGVPREAVYAVGASADGDALYAGTRPAHVYVARPVGGSPRDLEWRECDGFQDLPSREEWRLPRHENLAQVRDVHADPASPDRLVAGVEVGGVHVSEDGGDTWTERRDGVNDDVHELHVAGPGEYVAATGFGLFHTTDAGRSWTRLDEGFEQRYFRTAFSVDGTVFAGAALSNSANWNDADADPALFVRRDGGPLERVDHPRPDEVVTGMTAVDGSVVAGTHRGSLLVEDPDGWTVAGSFPVPGPHTGRYTPLTPIDS